MGWAEMAGERTNRQGSSDHGVTLPGEGGGERDLPLVPAGHGHLGREQAST